MSKASPELQNYIRYKNDPWAFLDECVYTLDQVDKDEPIKKFPSYYEYLRLYAKTWLKYPLIAVPKSRRMTMSWTNIALYLWDTIFHQGRLNAFVSKKEEDAKELVERAEFIFDHIPTDLIPKSLLPKKKTKSSPPVLEFPEINSKIQGFPMGADQLRQFTFSGILGDECAFWPEAMKFYSAAFPTLEGGGRMSLISSPAPGFFKKLVYDKLDSDDDFVTYPETKSPLKGVDVWVNPGNQFLIYQLHYTANQFKRSDQYKQSIKKSMPRRQYLQEYELNWDTFEGMPVYADYNKRLHLSKDIIEPKLGLPLLLGWDFGLTPSAVICQLQEDQLVILREYVAKGKGIQQFAPEVMQQLRVHYPEWNDPVKHFRNYIDPAGTFRNDVDANTCAKEMHNQGLRNIFPGDVTWEARRGAVDHFLVKHTKQGPAIIINEKTCPVLVKGFAGGYMYPEKASDVEPTKLRPIKNEYSHPHDALQYVCGAVKKMRSSNKLTIPLPQYGFVQPENHKEENTHGYQKIR